jgi:tellurite resistance protein
VSVKTTGHDKSRCTVILTANGSGKKLKPYVVFFGGTRKVKELNDKKLLSGCVATSSVNGWMNDELTADYLRRIIGKLAFKKRILVWDALQVSLE